MRALSTHSDDARLVAAHRDGDPRAFEAIHRRHAPALRRYAGRMLPHGELAEDIVQEAMLRASRALLRDRRTIDLKPWLFRIARNCALDELARHRFTTVDLHGAAEVVAAPGAGEPSAVHDRRAQLRAVLDDIAGLPAEQRHALVGRAVEGISHAELAAELGISEGAAKNLVHRARANLVDAREARSAPCSDVRSELLRAADEGRRGAPRSRRHLVGCSACRDFRAQIKRSNRALAILAPGPLLLGLGAVGGMKLGVGFGSAGAKGAALVGAGAVAVGAVGLGSQVLGPGDPAPQAIASRAVPAGLVAAGRALPVGTAVVMQRIELAAGATSARIEVRCPDGLRVADLLRPAEDPVSVAYASGTVLGADAGARILVRASASARPTRMRLGVLCKRPDAVGSLLAAGTRAFARATDHVRGSEPLRERPGGLAQGTVRAGQPVVRQASRGPWRRVLTDTGETGWVRATSLAPIG